MRVAVLIEDRCNPNSPAFNYLQKYAGQCGGECIQVEGNKCKILESACPPCLVRAKHCPGDAVSFTWPAVAGPRLFIMGVHELLSLPAL